MSETEKPAGDQPEEAGPVREPGKPAGAKPEEAGPVKEAKKQAAEKPEEVAKELERTKASVIAGDAKNLPTVGSGKGKYHNERCFDYKR